MPDRDRATSAQVERSIIAAPSFELYERVRAVQRDLHSADALYLAAKRVKDKDLQRSSLQDRAEHLSALYSLLVEMVDAGLSVKGLAGDLDAARRDHQPLKESWLLSMQEAGFDMSKLRGRV